PGSYPERAPGWIRRERSALPPASALGGEHGRAGRPHPGALPGPVVGEEHVAGLAAGVDDPHPTVGTGELGPETPLDAQGPRTPLLHHRSSPSDLRRAVLAPIK